MSLSILLNQFQNILFLILILALISLQWIILYADSILHFFYSYLSYFGFGISTPSSKQITKIPIISGLVSPQTIPKALQTINASDPSSPNYLQITPSYNQSQGLAFSLSLWLNIDSQQSSTISHKILFYKGSQTQNFKLQFENSQGLFHIDVSILSSFDSSSQSTFFIATFSNPNDDIVLNLINAIKSKTINFIILIHDRDNFFKISYIDDNSFSLYSQVTPSNQIDLSSFKVLKFAGYNNVQDVKATTSYSPYKIGYDFAYKTPLLRFGNSVNDLILEFNDNNTLNSYFIQLFDSKSTPYTTNFNKFFHLAITFSDRFDSYNKRIGTDIQWFINGTLYNHQAFDSHIHFNFGDFHIFPDSSKDNIITSQHNEQPDVQIADLTFYRQLLTHASILSIYKAGFNSKFPVINTPSPKPLPNIKLSTQNFNNV